MLFVSTGDLILEVNGHRVTDLLALSPLLASHYGKLSLAVVSLDSHHRSPADLRPPPVASDLMAPAQVAVSRVRKARDLFAEVSTERGFYDLMIGRVPF